MTLHEDGERGWRAEKYVVDGAGVITSLTRTDGLIELEEMCTHLVPGENVPFYAFGAAGMPGG